jgi:hypothetical protein
MDPLATLFERYRRHGDLNALGQVFDALAPRLLAWFRCERPGHRGVGDVPARRSLGSNLASRVRRALAQVAATPRASRG